MLDFSPDGIEIDRKLGSLIDVEVESSYQSVFQQKGKIYDIYFNKNLFVF